MTEKFEIARVGSLEIDEPIKFTERDMKLLPVGFVSIYRQAGWKSLLAGKSHAALRNFHLSAAADPNDRKTLTGRSHARCRTMRFSGALQDAEAVLKIDKYDKDAIFLQALCQYELGNFEEGLVMFYRGINRRGPRTEFRNGMDQVHNTIENCIGRHAGPALTNLLCAIRVMEAKRIKDLKAALKIPKYCAEDMEKKPKYFCSDEAWNRWQRFLTRQEYRMAQLYLGKLSEDREWYQRLFNNSNVNARNKVSTERIMAHGKSGLQDLETRFQILMSRKPFYHFVYLARSSKHLAKKKKEQTREEMKKVMKTVVGRALKKLESYRAQGETYECLRFAIRTEKFLHRVPKNYLHLSRREIFQKISRIMANVYLDRKVCLDNLSKVQNKRRLQYIMGNDREYNDMKIDPHVQSSNFPFLNCNEVLNDITDFLAVAESELEKAWLHHERSYIYSILNKWGHMQSEANKCIAAAEECHSLEWIANGLFLVFLAEIRRKDRVEAKEAMARSLKVAKSLRKDSLVKFLLIAKAIEEEREEVTTIVSGNTLIKKREDSIIGLMEDLSQRELARNLFTRMRFLPPERRLSVLPGFRHTPVRGQNFSTKSIIPGGSGGRLGFNAITHRTYLEFLDID